MLVTDSIFSPVVRAKHHGLNLYHLVCLHAPFLTHASPWGEVMLDGELMVLERHDRNRDPLFVLQWFRVLVLMELTIELDLTTEAAFGWWSP